MGINPKINNLMPGYEGARYNLVWICDSGIRGGRNQTIRHVLASRLLTLALRSVKPDTLTDMTNQMTDKVGLVHGLPYVADRQGFAATLEQVRLTRPWRARVPLLTGVHLPAGVFRHVPPAVLHLR